LYFFFSLSFSEIHLTKSAVIDTVELKRIFVDQTTELISKFEARFTGIPHNRLDLKLKIFKKKRDAPVTTSCSLSMWYLVVRDDTLDLDTSDMRLVHPGYCIDASMNDKLGF
jgi:hypothetical protein